MDRREFVKTTASLIALSSLNLSASNKNSNFRRFRVIQRYDLRYDEDNFGARLWVPLPYDASYQRVLSLGYSGNYDEVEINQKNRYKAKTLYASWKKTKNKKLLTLSFDLQTKNRSVNLELIKRVSRKNLPLPNSVKLYLEPTEHIPVTGLILKKSREITKGLSDRFKRVEAIYEWVCKTTFRDPQVTGCGVGDAKKMLESNYFGGKCTDISSLFVALLRASGIPAREVFGIRLGKSHFSKALGKSDENGFADISTWQHCRVEYYIPGVGWIPSDPADITKLELVEKRDFNDPKVQELKRRYLHSWEMNWIGFNSARDFKLHPTPTQYPLNTFGYPYAEVEDEVLNYYSPKNFIYHYTSQEIY
jgi:hypothetical protein